MNDTEKNLNTDIISANEAVTLPGLFLCRVSRSPQAIAYQQYAYEGEKWNSYTWAAMEQKITCWQKALTAEGLNPGDRVAIYLKNCVEWICFEQAAFSLRLVVVPVYNLDTPKNISYILQDSGCKIMLMDSMKNWQNLSAHQPNFPDLRHILYLEGAVKTETEKKIVFSKVANWLPDSIAAMNNHATDPYELATIIYTSGTTGRPKGVMLSHHNILWNSEAILKVVPAYPDDVFLSFLPLSHTFERTVGYYVPMMAGSQVVYARSVKDLAEDLLTIQSTVLISVPRIYERIYGRIQEQLKKKGPIAQKMFATTVEIGWRRFEASQGRRRADGVIDAILWPLLKRMVAQKVLRRLGGKVRLAVTGGAPLHERIGRLFIGLGLPLLQGYGLTECSPVVSANSIENNLPASVGPPLPDVEVRIGSDSELLVRCLGIMKGYWNQPASTAEVIDENGWLHTGDVVEIKDGRIYISGRLKEILVTSTGEKIPPASLEMALTEDPLFYQAMVVGEGKPYLAALIVFDRMAWQGFARGLSLDPGDPSSLVSPVIVSKVLQKIEGLISAFPSYARIRAVHLSTDSWTFEEGLVTSLMKLKRHEIEKRFAEEIEVLYAGHDLP
ncbi:MAG: long-chain fatty acid--CoA ligase [Desulfobulbaceae bacterium]|uniref:Long-chain fatty acid--CoA ligase n=1 Tax=Candidatus Desulfobia pelagia TaxID=2841692 RepID=A0A8J6NDM0_9BACT|nr:long-chain fatty acid--CoA ligase [Candidatus Desulfobia pelagia]